MWLAPDDDDDADLDGHADRDDRACGDLGDCGEGDGGDGLFGGGGAPEALTHRGLPIAGYNDGEPVPDLARIPREEWRSALAPLRRHTRQLARATVLTVEDARVAGILVGDLLAGGDRESRAFSAAAASLPAGALPPRGSGRQVNFRLGPGEYERLQEAARLFAMRPSTLARALTVRGVNLALHDERRAR